MLVRLGNENGRPQELVSAGKITPEAGHLGAQRLWKHCEALVWESVSLESEGSSAGDSDDKIRLLVVLRRARAVCGQSPFATSAGPLSHRQRASLVWGMD